MKTKEELNALKEEIKSLDEELRELTDEELVQVTGGTERVPVLIGTTTLLLAGVPGALTGDFTGNNAE